MTEEWKQIVGLAAGTLTTIAFVPQVVQAWRTQSVRDFSLGMLLAFNAGVSLWFVYGLALGELPIIIANGVTLGLALVLLWLKVQTPPS